MEVLQLLEESAHKDLLKHKQTLVDMMLTAGVINCGMKELTNEAAGPVLDKAEFEQLTTAVTRYGRVARMEVDKVYRMCNPVMDANDRSGWVKVIRGGFDQLESQIIRACLRAEGTGLFVYAFLVVRTKKEAEPLAITYRNGSFMGLDLFSGIDGKARKDEWNWLAHDGGKMKTETLRFYCVQGLFGGLDDLVEQGPRGFQLFRDADTAVMIGARQFRHGSVFRQPFVKKSRGQQERKQRQKVHQCTVE